MPQPRRRTHILLSGAALTALVVGTLAATGSPAPAGRAPTGGSDWKACASGPAARQAVFARASRISGVPEAVLLGVSYMESRWDAHGASPSSASGYGPMNLTHVVSRKLTRSDLDPMGKGDGHRSALPRHLPTMHVDTATMRTLDQAARLTQLPKASVRSDAAANICGGAALLARYQQRAGAPTGRLGDWSAAVARFSNARDTATALQFTREVFTKIRHGAARTTNDGQRVHLASHPAAHVNRAAVRSLGLAAPAKVPTSGVDCPATLSCGSVPAPYEQNDAAGNYGNHDIANRPHDMKINYIVIHDTEASWDESMKLVQDPTYLAWNYTVRSVDGHVAQHLDAKDVGYHAGNWYVNMHSIGVEHEGFAAQGASWYTEALYENSASLVRHLADEYKIPIDRAHIIGHDQVPAINPAGVAGMHWDPGPYWDWEHYMALLGAPIKADRHGHSDIVTVAPGFADNPQPVTGCDAANPTAACVDQGTNFVYLHTNPSADSPLVTDIGLRPDGSPSTTFVSDIGARATAGQKFLVAARSGDWLGVWWLGNIAWLYNPASNPAVVPSSGQAVVPRTDTPVQVYGTAYPAQTDYPADIPYDHPRVPLQYTIQPGQAYVLADRKIETDYYYAEAFNCVGTLECTEVNGRDKFYEIWFGHRVAYVKAADVRVTDGVNAS